uniref:Basonuclin 1 n=1 Tax=Iconisemion striatum TaxID=60296 RepID=A0A1A7YRT5_9TELE
MWCLTGSPLQQQHQQCEQHQQTCGVSLDQQGQRRDDQGRHNPFPRSHPSENSFLASSSISFSTDLDESGGKTIDSLSTSAKIEAEDFTISDNYSDRSSTPCAPSLNSDVPQMSPEGKLYSLDRSGSNSGGSLKKGRVFCNACEKTFYDKGTLKIHYNAVHLKIKHKCTIEGCNMVFSSLRSRNRHSANPNPRLHMPMNRNNRDRDLRGGLAADESSQGEKKTEYRNPISICSAENQRSVPSYVMSHVDSGHKLHSSSFPSAGQSGILFPNLKTVQPVLPFYRSLVTPAELANTPGTLPSLPILSSSVHIKPITEPISCVTDSIPKKKSRKSSMPIKIEKDMIAQDDQIDKASSSEDELPLQATDIDECESNQGVEHMCTRQPGQQKEAREATKNLINHTCDQQLADNEDKHEGSRAAKVVVINCVSSQSENNPLEKQNDNSLCQESNDSEEGENREHTNTFNICDKSSEVTMNEGEYEVTNGGSPQLTEKGGLDDSDLSHPCEICSKPFKNPYSGKMHNQNVHLKEMHMCTTDGCNATFPSRRSRDRHSANLNLHHKLLTKDSLISITTLCSPSSHCKDRNSVSQDNYHDQQNTDLPHLDQITQTSVIFRGHNRMGLVFPISKMPAPPSGAEVFPLDMLGGGETCVNVNNGTVLDLSTTTSTPPCGSSCAESSMNSDGAGSEEGETNEEVEDVLMEDSDESCDETGVGRPMGEELVLGGDRNLGSSGGGQNGLHGIGVGSPITCHVCQKVYSNKGTFRAHYKTVHLRLLHKCKVPGCDTSFSSVRSRNRHSQNPNLHRNLSANSGTTVDQE